MAQMTHILVRPSSAAFHHFNITVITLHAISLLSFGLSLLVSFGVLWHPRKDIWTSDVEALFIHSSDTNDAWLTLIFRKSHFTINSNLLYLQTGLNYYSQFCNY